MRLRISARQSDLARLQAYTVGEALQKKNPGLKIAYRFKESLGDKNLTDPLWKLPEKGVFTEDFLGELLNDETDMVVHSWKDLPTELKTETVIAASLPRADQRDLLLMKKSHFERIRAAKRVRIFSSSPRRAYNLTSFLKDALPFGQPQVAFESVRGNIPTRIRKLIENDEVGGLIVAKAALDRLLTAPQPEFAEVQKLLRGMLAQLSWMALPLSVNPNAAAQGALAVEVATKRADLLELLSHINDQDSYETAQEERKILASFGGGCHQKIGVARLKRDFGDILVLKGLTDAGEVLDRHEILSHGTTPARFNENEMWPARGENAPAFTRETLPTPALPGDANALFVAKAEAWPAELKFNGLVWTAGVSSWKKLAALGVWVSGCTENLGEKENPQAEVLASSPLRWYKLSHSDGVEGSMPLIATYRLKRNSQSLGLENKKAFYWASGSLFQEAVRQNPAILKGSHASGPGHTHETIRQALKAAGEDSARATVYLSEDEWRRKCQS